MSRESASAVAFVPAREAPSAILHAEPDLVPARGGRRSAVLHRLLALSDAAAGLTAGGLAAIATGFAAHDALAMGAVCALVLPLR